MKRNFGKYFLDCIVKCSSIFVTAFFVAILNFIKNVEYVEKTNNTCDITLHNEIAYFVSYNDSK